MDNDRVRQKADHRSFHLLIDELKRQREHPRIARPNNVPADSFESALVAMAVDRGKHSLTAFVPRDVANDRTPAFGGPVLYDELVEEYGRYHGSRHAHVKDPAWLKDEHATEKYRLTWESLFIAPASREVLFMDRRPLEALRRIGNQASFPVLVKGFESACRTRPAGNSRAAEMPHRILWCLSCLPSERNLGAVLECLSMSDRAEAREAGSVTLRDRCFRYLVDPVYPSDGANRERLLLYGKWREIVERYPKEGVSVKDLELFDRILSFERKSRDQRLREMRELREQREQRLREP